MTTQCINDYTKAELQDILAQALANRPSKDRACLLCGVVVKMRPDQKFCSNTCRATHHKESALIHEILMQKNIDDLRRQLNDCLKEIHFLREENTTLRNLLQKE